MLTTAELARALERGRPFHTNVLVLVLILLGAGTVRGQPLIFREDRLFAVMNNAASMAKKVAVSSSSRSSKPSNSPPPPPPPPPPPRQPSPPPRPPIPANWVNLALGQPTYASSSFVLYLCPDFDCNPKYIVDGNTTSLDAVYQSDFGDVAPWVSIDLGALAAVHRVVLYARSAFLIPQQSGLEVRVGNTSITTAADTSLVSENPVVWQQSSTTEGGAVLDIYLDSPVVGRWVTAQSSIPFMALVEAQVFGVYEADPLAPKPSSAPSPPAAPPGDISDPPVSGMTAQCGEVGKILHMHDNGVCVNVTFSCPYMWALGEIAVTYRFIYERADGSRSSGTNALKMNCFHSMYADPQMYVEFASPFALGPGEYLVLQQKNWTASCGSMPWNNPGAVEWEDVARITFTTPRTFMYLIGSIPHGPSVNWTSQNCSEDSEPPSDYFNYYYYGTPPSDGNDNKVYDLRLINGSWDGEGILEVFDGRRWGTICADSFTDIEAAVACRDLGYPSGVVVTPNQWGDGNGRIVLDDVDCRFRVDNISGVPETFSQCYSGVFNFVSCETNQVVGIRCYGNNGPTQPPLPPSPPPPRPPNPSTWANLALNRPAFASSALRGRYSDRSCGIICGPTLATDGSFARTSTYQSSISDDTQPWLSIDLGTAAAVHQIVIASNLLFQPSNFVEIRVGNVSITQTRSVTEAEDLLSQNQLVWSQGRLAKPFYSRQLQFFVEPPVIGRWVTVHSSLIYNVAEVTNMIVQEVQVFGVPPVPPAPVKSFQLRLVGGRAPNSGRVEMFSGSVWGTICDRTFDNAAATVACRELGYKSGVAVPGWGSGIGPILMTDVRCDPAVHKRLSQCQPYTNDSAHTCVHRQDVGVICKDTAVSLSEAPFIPVSISAGGLHTCAISRVGKVKCFGQNMEGQLGLGDFQTRGARPEDMGALLPTVNLGPRLTATAIATGLFHTCAIMQPGGVVKCWGRNTEGQLGLGNSRNRGDEQGQMGSDLPAVDLGPGLRASALAAGFYHTCAILQPGGIVKCWGYNYNGELGLGDTNWRGNYPDQMGSALPIVDLGPGLKATDIAAGADHTCVVLQPGGIVKCWGYNADAQLGLGDLIARGGKPGQMGANLPPVDLGRGFKATNVACGTKSSCALDQSSGLVKCWGDNFYGQLGQGDILRRGDQPEDMGRELKPIALGEGYRPTEIVAGAYHTCALLQPGGVVKCWGSNYGGAVGLEANKLFGDQPRDMGDFLNPVSLGQGLNATAITAGYGHTCALLQPGNIVKCWGNNAKIFAGVLGQGDLKGRGITKNSMGDNLPPVKL
ncbi:hypothetical protein Vafri_10919 [Volvox africanus]|uniref:SRCR domain-containing protein n=1 Tax=Volvox africanus TaxID=51714 RepID=A0A8J4B6X7_9CHLO|nr:hypothetical protein Vafri_10919 [Volvox africanus]